MIDFDIEKFVREYMTGRAESLLKEYLPNFSHISKGKSLDGRM